VVADNAAEDLERFQRWRIRAAPGLKRLLKNVYFVRSALLRACLRQIGVVYFRQLSGTDESVP